MSTARGFVRFPFLKHTVTENTEQLSFLYDLRVSVLFVSDFLSGIWLTLPRFTELRWRYT